MIQFGNVHGMSCHCKRKNSCQWFWLGPKSLFTYKVTWTPDAQGNPSKRQVAGIWAFVCHYFSSPFQLLNATVLQLLNAAVSYFMVLREFDNWILYGKCCSAAKIRFSNRHFHRSAFIFLNIWFRNWIFKLQLLNNNKKFCFNPI